MGLKFKSLHIRRNIDKTKQNKTKQPTEWEKIFSNCITRKWLLEAPLADQLVKNPPAMQETWVQSLGCEVPLKKEMAPHSNILAWKIPWTEEPGRLQSMGLQVSDTTERLSQHPKYISSSYNSIVKSQATWLISRIPEETSFKRRYTDGKEAHEKTLSVTNQRNTNQNDSKIVPHTSQNGCQENACK